jgi:hypothetical protein
MYTEMKKNGYTSEEILFSYKCILLSTSSEQHSRLFSPSEAEKTGVAVTLRTYIQEMFDSVLVQDTGNLQ